MLESGLCGLFRSQIRVWFCTTKERKPISNVATAQYVAEIDRLGIKISSRGRNHLGWSFSICVNSECKQNFTAHKKNPGVYMWGREPVNLIVWLGVKSEEANLKSAALRGQFSSHCFQIPKRGLTLCWICLSRGHREYKSWDAKRFSDPFNLLNYGMGLQVIDLGK